MKPVTVAVCAGMILLILSACQLISQPQENTTPSITETTPQTQPSVPETTAPPPTEVSQPTEPTEVTQPTEPAEVTQPTEPAEVTQPTEPTEVTQPTEPAADLYTKEQLDAMSTKPVSYGPGKTSGGKPAPYAVTHQKEYGKYGASFMTNDENCIYLTFDCGYEYFAKDENGKSYPVTGRILDVLKEKNTKAVFFITLSYAQKNPELVWRMIREGHVVGNHTSTHPDTSQLSVDDITTEIMTLHNYMLDTYGYKMTLFRPPEGKFSVRSLATAQNLGYTTVLWSFAYADWETDDQPDKDYAWNRITESAHSGAIYLLHAVSTVNAELLGDVIDNFQSRNYKIPLLG